MISIAVNMALAISPQDPGLAISLEIYPELELLENEVLNFIKVYLPFYNPDHTIVHNFSISLPKCVMFFLFWFAVAVLMGVRFGLVVALIGLFSSDW